MVQDRIYSYFEGNPQLHVLFISDKMNIEKYNTFSIASSRQDMRKCKEFTVTFMKTKNA